MRRLIDALENNFHQNRNHFPKTVAEAYNLLTNWWKQERTGWRTPTADGVAFTNVDDKKTPRVGKAHITCHKCKRKDTSYAPECPEKLILSQYRDVIIGADIMFVNKHPFFVTISRNIKFGTAVLIANQKLDTLVKAARKVRNIYKKRGFTTTIMLMDGQFEGITGDLAEIGITLNTDARGKHDPEAERFIRTIKERARCV